MRCTHFSFIVLKVSTKVECSFTKCTVGLSVTIFPDGHKFSFNPPLDRQLKGKYSRLPKTSLKWSQNHGP